MAAVKEWAFQRVATTDATVTNDSINLALRDDEIAEIHELETEILTGAREGTSDTIISSMVLSMDPDIADDPSLEATAKDLEVFHHHREQNDLIFTTSGASSNIQPHPKFRRFDPPILVGTNVGMSCKGDATVAVEFNARLWFTRRRATATELNRILLKRR